METDIVRLDGWIFFSGKMSFFFEGFQPRCFSAHHQFSVKKDPDFRVCGVFWPLKSQIPNDGDQAADQAYTINQIEIHRNRGTQADRYKFGVTCSAPANGRK